MGHTNPFVSQAWAQYNGLKTAQWEYRFAPGYHIYFWKITGIWHPWTGTSGTLTGNLIFTWEYPTTTGGGSKKIL
jgi:hypothetical protein